MMAVQTPTRSEGQTRTRLTVAEVIALGLVGLLALPALGVVLLVLAII